MHVYTLALIQKYLLNTYLCSSARFNPGLYKGKKAGMISPFRPVLNPYHAQQYSITWELNSFVTSPSIAYECLLKHLLGKKVNKNISDAPMGVPDLNQVFWNGGRERKNQRASSNCGLGRQRYCCAWHIWCSSERNRISNFKIARAREPSKTFQ